MPKDEHSPLLRFPKPQSAEASGLVAVTPDLSWQLLLAAYSQGIFPWADNPVRWYSPDPRAIFDRDRIHLPRNLGRLMRQAAFCVTFDTAFVEVVEACAQAHAHDGVWITPRFVAAYTDLHAEGFAHSVEVWQQDRLVGGLYGVQIGQAFAGESMFHLVPNASKAAFHGLLGQLDQQGVCLIDAQVLNDHTERLGARNIPRADYLRRLKGAIARPAPGSGAPWFNSLASEDRLL